jgi:hypothetical protein
VAGVAVTDSRLPLIAIAKRPHEVVVDGGARRRDHEPIGVSLQPDFRSYFVLPGIEKCL